MMQVAHIFILARVLFIVSGDLEPIGLSVQFFLNISNIISTSLDISKIVLHVQSLVVLSLVVVEEGLNVDQHGNYDVPLLAFK